MGPTVKSCSSLVAATSFERAAKASLSSGEIDNSSRPSASKEGREILGSQILSVNLGVLSDRTRKLCKAVGSHCHRRSIT